ncbi:hypothetical protein [Kitasatospora griseola]|uniref:hypothetical protein n=1 Tax=Kitasatospora griseola TaxID=2064 RepID=UPI003825C953
MDTITVLHSSAPGAPARVAAIANEAVRFGGYETVETAYEPPTGLYVVTGEPTPGQ